MNDIGYAFIEFESSEDADYAIRCMNMIKLFGKPPLLWHNRQRKIRNKKSLMLIYSLVILILKLMKRAFMKHSHASAVLSLARYVCLLIILFMLCVMLTLLFSRHQ
jgi:hypothetical protein